jgi:DNA-binding NarL/FixJ family response regulator
MEGADTIRLLLAEDHVVVRQGLRTVLAADPRLVVVAEAGTGYEILALVLQHRPDVLLLDLALPGQNGLAALRGLREHVRPVPRTLVLSAWHGEEQVRQARELGVAGFLGKGCDCEQLRRAVHDVARGRPAFDPALAAIVRGQEHSKRGRFRRYADGSEALTPAELVVLRKMMGTQIYEEIARALGCSPGTVRTQAAAVCQKLGVASRQQAVLKALRLGILHLDEA